MIKPG
jgi:hypothetical protein